MVLINNKNTFIKNNKKKIISKVWIIVKMKKKIINKVWNIAIKKAKMKEIRNIIIKLMII